MRSSLTSLRFCALLSSALGFLSITLTGEIGAAWLIASWTAWIFSLVSGRFSVVEAAVRRLEIFAVVAMVATLLFDFLIFRSTIFLAITHFLLLFQIVKLAGEKGRRDYLQMFLFSFFQILAACTLSVDAWHAGVLLALIPIAAAVLFWNQIESQNERFPGRIHIPEERRYRGMAAGISASALPVNVVLTLVVFMLFPRLTLNASLPGFTGHRAGYTDQINLAQKGKLQEDASVVMWLSFSKPEERQLWDGYLRGDVLTQFDGRRWNSAARTSGSRLVTPDSNGIFALWAAHAASTLLHQTITLADTSANTIFAASRAARITAPLPALQIGEGGSLHWLVPWRRPLRYDVVSEPVADMEVRPADVELPKISLGRIKALARKVAGQGAAAAQAENIERYLRNNYKYTTQYGDHIPDNPVDYFLFEHPEGLCGHFASAMALMLRLQHIPSRIVAGYLKGEWNEPAQCVVVRERDAHAWVEAYLPHEGWVAFDPSPRLVSGAGGAVHRNVFERAAQYWDYFGLQWNRFVIQYDLYSQIKALENLKGTTDRFGSALSIAWLQWGKIFHPSHRTTGSGDQPEDNTPFHFPWKRGGAFLFLTFSLLAFFHKRSTGAHAAIAFYQRFLDQMARAGHPKREWETGQEYAVRLAREKPDLVEFIRQITQKYYHLRYGKGSL